MALYFVTYKLKVLAQNKHIWQLHGKSKGTADNGDHPFYSS